MSKLEVKDANYVVPRSRPASAAFWSESSGVVVDDFFKPHEPVQSGNWLPSLTRQEFAQDADINVIMERYKDNDLPAHNQRQPQYIDLTVAPADLLEAMNELNAATQAFADLPAYVRREFENDPYQFVEFASDPENLSQMRTWGLAPPAPEPPAPIRVVMDPVSAPSPGEPSKAV